MSITTAQIVSPAATLTHDRVQAAVAALADLAGNTGRDAAAGLLQGILRELRTASRASA